ncbi:MAG: ribosome small subunit-dependent GTPase A [Chitinophagaceae bacterium]
MKAIIYKSTGSWYTAKTSDNRTWQCRIAGKMKIDEDITTTNPVAVGDEVEIEIENEDQQTAIITSVEDRNNYIIRASPHSRIKNQIVAANIDQAVLIATLKEPKTSQGFIDRYLVSAAAYHVPAVIIFNKQDLYHAKEMKHFYEWEVMYKKVGYPVLLASALKEEGLEEIINILKNKTSLFAGHSGVGKSTLINDLIPQLYLKTQMVSDWSGKGTHTTTFAEMFELPSGGKIIDTPGIRELGIVDMEKTELSQYFLDLLPYLSECHFNNCLHINEPGCAVKEAVERGDITDDRYESYLAMLSTMQEQGW